MHPLVLVLLYVGHTVAFQQPDVRLPPTFLDFLHREKHGERLLSPDVHNPDHHHASFTSGHALDDGLTWEEAWPGLVMALVAGLSTVLGAFIVFCLPTDGVSPNVMSFGLSLAAGVMISVSVLELLPEGNGVDFVDLGIFFGGALLCFMLCKLAECLEFQSRPTESPRTASKEASGEAEAKREQQKSMRLAILLFVSLTAHNFPEGLAVMISALHDQSLGLIVMVAIALHNIPEGIAICISTYAATKSRARAVLMSFLSGLTEPLGALCALLLLYPYLTPSLIEHLLILVAGVMCYVAVFELLPEAASTGKWVMMGLGLLVGAAVMVATHMYLEH